MSVLGNLIRVVDIPVVSDCKRIFIFGNRLQLVHPEFFGECFFGIALLLISPAGFSFFP